MSATTFRAALMGVSMLALNACVSITVTHEVETVPVAAAPAVTVTPARESTAFTLGTDQPRTPEQLAMVFDKADLSIKVIPETKTIEAVAVLERFSRALAEGDFSAGAAATISAQVCGGAMPRSS